MHTISVRQSDTHSHTCDNNLILHIYIIIKKHYHTYFELIHAFYS